MKYIELKADDILQQGDEYKHKEGWHDVPPSCYGEEIGVDMILQYAHRRPIKKRKVG